MLHMTPSGTESSGEGQIATDKAIAPHTSTQAPSKGFVQENSDQKTIGLMSRSLYATKLEVDRLKLLESCQSVRIKKLEAVLAAHADLAVTHAATLAERDNLWDVRRELRNVVHRYIDSHNLKAFAVTCECKICIDARRLLR